MPMQELGPYQIGLQTRRETTDEAVKFRPRRVGALSEGGPSEAELTQAKNNLIGGFPMRIDSNKKNPRILAVIAFTVCRRTGWIPTPPGWQR